MLFVPKRVCYRGTLGRIPPRKRQEALLRLLDAMSTLNSHKWRHFAPRQLLLEAFHKWTEEPRLELTFRVVAPSGEEMARTIYKTTSFQQAFKELHLRRV